MRKTIALILAVVMTATLAVSSAAEIDRSQFEVETPKCQAKLNIFCEDDCELCADYLERVKNGLAVNEGIFVNTSILTADLDSAEMGEALAILKILAGIDELTAEALATLDFDGDGEITIMDALATLKKLAGI